MNKYKQNQIESSVNKKSGYKSIRKLIVVVLAAIFVLGGGIAIYRSNKKSGVVSQAELEVTTQIPGWWNQRYFKSSVCDSDQCQPDADPDKDKLTNLQEYYYHSDPLDSHTVGDAMDDGELVANNFDPSKSGRVTFDQLLTDESIIGESLVFDSDIAQLINESVDPNNVTLPEVKETDLQITHDNSREVMLEYVANVKKIMSDAFPSDAANYIEQVAASPNDGSIALVRSRCQLAVAKLKSMLVPTEFLQIHKLNIMLLDLLPDVINTPPSSSLVNDYDPAGNFWFDKTQAMMTVYQKLELESLRLSEKYK